MKAEESARIPEYEPLVRNTRVHRLAQCAKLTFLRPRWIGDSEETEIGSAYESFARIMRRRFTSDSIDDPFNISPLPSILMSKGTKKLTLEQIFPLDLNLNSKLYFLKRDYISIFEKIVSNFQNAFPFITKIDIKDASQFQTISIVGNAIIPVCYVQEKGGKQDIPLQEISSGMKKVLLLLTDVYTVPEGTVLLIDEYENSLGINAINVLPDILLEQKLPIQIVLTSHHPYIINRIPVNHWYVFHRHGTSVQIRFGAELSEKYGKSKQSAFIQLINDEYFSDGVK